MPNTFVLYFRRECQLLFRNIGSIVQPIAFFLIISLLFPLSQTVKSSLFTTIGAGIIWVAALLATLLSMENMFKADYRDGILEQWLLQSRSLTATVAGKISAHWLLSGFLITCLAPLLGVAFGLDGQQNLVLMLSLLLGTPSLTLIGAIAAALTVTLNKGGVLRAIIVLPLYIPVLIFGAGMVGEFSGGGSINSLIYALAAILSVSVTLAPFAVAGALRLTIT